MAPTGAGAVVVGRPPPEAKEDFSEPMIKEEQEDMNRHGWDVSYSEAHFGELPRTDYLRFRHVGLCLQGVCSLSALEYPMSWDSVSDDDSPCAWLRRMLLVFRCYYVNSEVVQAEWGVPHGSHWFDYNAPYLWFETVVTRSFTSLDAVFNIIRSTGRFGLVKDADLKRLEEDHPPNPAWKADINTNSTTYWGGSGTFACCQIMLTPVSPSKEGPEYVQDPDIEELEVND
ncbi:hypothetical protein V496_02998 [Pseudogymnoascus sp. VKM F-4515 (FW-2607)]|nr:hypothetical protein V496_02998 [Pseudogymnoascus sp. VKM F-4515 (FW-2607)]KFY91107.1 hypothetical protein V498_05696 [Pseudogymnoascus sp. VKM F-4517 (FW-2822)]